jgi:hypothetical protein
VRTALLLHVETTPRSPDQAPGANCSSGIQIMIRKMWSGHRIKVPVFPANRGVTDGARTHDLRNRKETVGVTCQSRSLRGSSGRFVSTDRDKKGYAVDRLFDTCPPILPRPISVRSWEISGSFPICTPTSGCINASRTNEKERKKKPGTSRRWHRGRGSLATPPRAPRPLSCAPQARRTHPPSLHRRRSVRAPWRPHP